MPIISTAKLHRPRFLPAWADPAWAPRRADPGRLSVLPFLPRRMPADEPAVRADGALLIADCGTPPGPWGPWIVAAMILAQVWALTVSDHPQIRPTPRPTGRPPIVRVVGGRDKGG